jgi:hypothetical protein
MKEREEGIVSVLSSSFLGIKGFTKGRKEGHLRSNSFQMASAGKYPKRYHSPKDQRCTGTPL